MKVLLTAFALLSFVAASALPMTASAEDMNKGGSTMSKPDTGPKTDSSMSSDKGTMDTGKSATSTSHPTTHKAATHKTHKKTTKKRIHHKHTATHKTKPKTTSAPPKQG